MNDTCPNCQVTGDLSIRSALETSATAPPQLQGTPFPITVTFQTVVHCDNCGWTMYGHLERVRLDRDSRQFATGEFVADRTVTQQ